MDNTRAEGKHAPLGTAESAVAASQAPAREEEFVRFSLVFRLQHMGLFIGVIILIITGLPLKFSGLAPAGWILNLMGGVHASAFIHRIGAVILIAVGVFHMFYITITSEGRREFLELVPRLKDFTDVAKNVLFFFGFLKTAPKFGRYSYIEKFDYWAVYWGMVIMIGTGLVLWFYDLTMLFLPKLYVDVAREAHSDEALLATLAILIWHFYNVHFNPRRFPMSWTWLTGKISKEEMLHHHPLEYEELTAKREESGADAEAPKGGEDHS